MCEHDYDAYIAPIKSSYLVTPSGRACMYERGLRYAFSTRRKPDAPFVLTESILSTSNKRSLGGETMRAQSSSSFETINNLTAHCMARLALRVRNAQDVMELIKAKTPGEFVRRHESHLPCGAGNL